MKYTSIIEKLICLWNIISKNTFYSVFIIITLILTLLLITKKLKRKKYLIFLVLNYIALGITGIVTNFKELGKILDNISTNFFTNIYFPSIYTYLFVILTMDIITIKSILNKEEKPYKLTNYIYLGITQFLFILITNIVATNKIDIFVKKSLFSNTSLIILLELTMIVFLLWILTRTIIYTTSKITEAMELKKIEIPNNNIVLNNTLVVEDIKQEEPQPEEPKEKYIYATEESKILEDTFSLNDLIFASRPEEKEEIKIEEPKVNSEELLNQLLNNGLPIIHEVEEEKEKDNYTLNDYRIFNKILKDIRETNHSNIISIDKELEYRLKNKYSEEEYNLFKLMLKNYSN